MVKHKLAQVGRAAIIGTEGLDDLIDFPLTRLKAKDIFLEDCVEKKSKLFVD